VVRDWQEETHAETLWVTLRNAQIDRDMMTVHHYQQAGIGIAFGVWQTPCHA